MDNGWCIRYWDSTIGRRPPFGRPTSPPCTPPVGFLALLVSGTSPAYCNQYANRPSLHVAHCLYLFYSVLLVVFFYLTSHYLSFFFLVCLLQYARPKPKRCRTTCPTSAQWPTLCILQALYQANLARIGGWRPHDTVAILNTLNSKQGPCQADPNDIIGLA